MRNKKRIEYKDEKSIYRKRQRSQERGRHYSHKKPRCDSFFRLGNMLEDFMLILNRWDEQKQNIPRLFNSFYKKEPFSKSIDWQTYGNVLQFILTQTVKNLPGISATRSQEIVWQWLKLFNYTFHHVKTPRDIATIVHRLGKLSGIKKKFPHDCLANQTDAFQSLLKNLAAADPHGQNIAITLLGFGYLAKSGQLPDGCLLSQQQTISAVLGEF